MRYLLLKNSFTFLGTLVLFFGSYYITHAQAVTPASISGLTSCLSSEFILQTCGGIVTASEVSFTGGSFRGNDIVAGDLLKCVLGNSFGSKPVCTVTHADKTNSISQESFFGALHSSSTDQHGNVTATADKSATDRVAGAAGGIIENTVTAAASAAVIAASYAILTFTQYLLALAGTLFNFVMLRTVFQFSTLIGNSPGLLIGWGLLRDIGNMVLLFGFLYIGISTILNLGTYTVKKSLPGLLIFAVLINFSLFAAEAVIDTSNLFSTVMYSQANTNPCPDSVLSGKPADPKTLQDCSVNYGIAGHILQTTGLSSVWKIPQGLDANFTNASVLLGISLFSMVAVIVLVAASIMLVARAVILTFVMVTAPIGFAAMALPTKSMKDLSSKWQSALLNQSFFAPIFLLLILVSLKIVDSFSRDGNLGEALMKQNTSIMGIIMIFVVVIGFMIGSLVAAKKFGAVGATGALNIIKKGGDRIKSIPRATGSFAGRNTLGLASAKIQKSYDSSKTARFINKIPVIGSSIDIGLSNAAGAARKSKFGGSTSYDERVKRDKDRVEALDKIEKDDKKGARGKEQEEELKNAIEESKKEIPAGTSDEERQKIENDRVDKLAEAIDKFSVAELQELDAVKKGGENLEIIAKNLSSEKFAALVKDGNDKVSEGVKDQLKDARFRSVVHDVAKINEINKIPAAVRTPEQQTALGESMVSVKKNLKAYSSKDLQSAPQSVLTSDAFAKSVSDGQRDDLIKSGNLSPSVQRKLKAEDPLEILKSDYANNGSNDAAATVVAAKMDDFKKPKRLAKLPEEMLKRDDIIDKLPVVALKEINRTEDIYNETRAKIASRLRDPNRTALLKEDMVSYLDSREGRQAWP